MRSVINISLPEVMEKIVEREIKKERFSTKSEFFRMLIRLWVDGKFAQELEESRNEFRAGKGRVLGSLKDLR